MTTEPTLSRLRSRIEVTLPWPPSAEWTMAHFEELSERVYEASGTRLSVATLKRLWGRVSYTSKPSMPTLDALAKTAGYRNWLDAEEQMRVRVRVPPPTLTEPVAPREKEARVPKWRTRFRPSVLGFAGALLALLLVATVGPQLLTPYRPPVQVERFGFTRINEGLPATFRFEYAVNGAVDTLEIQQSWDRRLRHRVDPDRGFHAATYYYPGAFRAKLVADDSVLLERPLIVGSDGWVGTVTEQGARAPRYLPSREVEKGGCVRIEGDGEESALHLVGGLTDLSTDTSFTLVTTFRSHGDDVCRRGRIIIHGERGAVILPRGALGCSGEFEVYACGETFSGRAYDLAGFRESEIGPPTELAVSLASGVLTVARDGESFFTEPVPRAPGKIVGVRYAWPKAGAVTALSIGGRDLL